MQAWFFQSSNLPLYYSESFGVFYEWKSLKPKSFIKWKFFEKFCAQIAKIKTFLLLFFNPLSLLGWEFIFSPKTLCFWKQRLFWSSFLEFWVLFFFKIFFILQSSFQSFGNCYDPPSMPHLYPFDPPSIPHRCPISQHRY